MQYYERALKTNKNYHTKELYLNLMKCYIKKHEFIKAKEISNKAKDFKDE